MNETVGHELVDLRKQIKILSVELEEASREKIQAAEYGLQVLEEKQTIQERFTELEALYETTKQELDSLREALNNVHMQQKQATQHGVQHEETLLAETSAKESQLQGQISSLEQEYKNCAQELSRTKAELEKLQTLYSEIMQVSENVSNQRKALKDELRELKLREQRLMVDYAELEDENISLQKQVSLLKSSQIEFESSKHEVQRLIEENELLQSSAEEANKLKQMAEKQMEDALTSLQHEREQRLTLKREFDQLKSADQLSQLNSLAHSFFGISTIQNSPSDVSFDQSSSIDTDEQINTDETETEESDGALKQLESAFDGKDAKLSSNGHTAKPTGKGDLFSEVHGARFDEITCELEDAKRQKSDVEKRCQELSRKIDEARTLLDDHADQLTLTVRRVQTPTSGASVAEAAAEDANEQASRTIVNGTMSGSSGELHLERVKARLTRSLQQLGAACDKLKRQPDVAALTRLSNEQVKEINSLEEDLITLNRLAADSQTTLICAQDCLLSVSEHLAQIYHHVCTAQGKTPDRIMLDHVKQVRAAHKLGDISVELPSRELNTSNGASGGEASGAESGTDAESPATATRLSAVAARQALHEKVNKSLNERLKSKFKERLMNDDKVIALGSDKAASDDAVKRDEKETPPLFQVLDTVSDQLRFLRKSVEVALISGQQPHLMGEQLPQQPAVDVEDLLNQNVKLRALLSTKREQIATLRMVLKSNKQTAEAALSHLKLKYEADKSFVSDTMNKLRVEMKSLKEEAATFASLRAMFTARCEEYQAREDELKQQVKAAEEEKKTLNSLLRMAIQQKLALTQRLEDLEMDRERHSMRRPSNPQRASGGGGQNFQSPRGNQPSGGHNGPARVQYPNSAGGGRNMLGAKRDY